MNDQLRRAALARKLTYLGIIVGLFTLSMAWRGKLGNARLSIAGQAQKLEMRELDLGDAEVAGSAARVSLVGFRGIVVTGMWWSAIEKQKRGEYHEFELLARTVTRLQPHFIEPWLFQAWNISYNVSVENDKLGDMYFYIARGIELLAEGDRLNSREYRGAGPPVQVGSPDIRYQIGFYYQNKFTVSDKVATLRSLMQLSAMKPSERDPAALLDPQDRVLPDKFKKFCEDNPQLVRRLADKVQCKTPRDVVDFLRVNRKVPARFQDDGTPNRDDRLPEDQQFPILPRVFPSERVEYTSLSDTDDAFDALHAARAWFESAQAVVPPPDEGFAHGAPQAAPAGRAPRLGEYDPFRYRMPARPSLIIFRMQPGRAQTYLAERLQKEGWFDAATRWNPADDGLREWADSPLAAKRNSQAEFAASFAIWDEFGRKNGLWIEPERRKRMEEAAERTKILGPVDARPNTIPQTDEDFERLGISRDDFRAKMALISAKSNIGVTNYVHFRLMTQAEGSPELVNARKLLAAAEKEKENGSFVSAGKQYARALAAWRAALTKYAEYRRQGDFASEQTAEFELTFAGLLKDDDAVRQRLPGAKAALLALASTAAPAEALDADWRNLLAEDEAVSRIALEMANNRGLDPATAAVIGGGGGAAVNPAFALDAAVAAKVPNGDDAAKLAARRALIDGPFSWMKRRTAPNGDAWALPDTYARVRQRMGLVRPAPSTPEPAGAPQMPGQRP